MVLLSIPRKIVENGGGRRVRKPSRRQTPQLDHPDSPPRRDAYLLLVRRKGVLSGFAGVILGLFGSAAAIAPRQYLDFGLSLVYENPDDITVNSWVLPVTRLLGLVALVLTIVSLRGEDAD